MSALTCGPQVSADHPPNCCHARICAWQVDFSSLAGVAAIASAHPEHTPRDAQEGSKSQNGGAHQVQTTIVCSILPQIEPGSSHCCLGVLPARRGVPTNIFASQQIHQLRIMRQRYTHLRTLILRSRGLQRTNCCESWRDMQTNDCVEEKRDLHIINGDHCTTQQKTLNSHPTAEVWSKKTLTQSQNNKRRAHTRTMPSK